MTKPRSEQIHADLTPYYHCMVRCVRRAFLCGEDYSTGQNYDHRKQWIVFRLRFLSYVYAIDICAYSVMSNHYYVIVHIDEKRAQGWSDREVAEYWLQLSNGNVLIKRCMNERIAAMANAEDGVKGRFWEGRFKSQALLDEVALLTCMAYVDLNPIRAQMADSLETSDFTSVQQRLYDYSATMTPESPLHLTYCPYEPLLWRKIANKLLHLRFTATRCRFSRNSVANLSSPCLLIASGHRITVRRIKWYHPTDQPRRPLREKVLL